MKKAAQGKFSELTTAYFIDKLTKFSDGRRHSGESHPAIAKAITWIMQTTVELTR